MFIVMTATDEGQETDTFETKKEAFDFAKECVTDNGGTANVYKATLFATAEKAVTISKVRKQKVAKQEVFEKAKDRLIERKKKASSVLSPDLIEIAKDSVPPEMDEVEESDIPIGARCALDMNMAVGKKMGPTGEWTYLCLDCMGAVTRG